MLKKNDNNRTCSHCGAVNIHSPLDWLNQMEGRAPLYCSNCKKKIDDTQCLAYTVSQKGSNLKFNFGFFIIAFILSVLMIYLNRTFTVFTFKEDSGQIAYEIVLILVVSSAIASGKIRQNLKYLAIWIAIFTILMAGYSYRYELTGIKDKILAEIIPSKGIQKTPDSISFPASEDGHFYIRAEVNKIPIMFLADTGASNIVFSPADAVKLGIKSDELRFDRIYETANGIVRGSSIIIDDLKIGKIHLKKIGASVNEANMRNSLLGMTFFKRLKSYEVKNDVLTLYGIEN